MMFKDRAHAGRELAKKLEAYRRASAVVLSLPRGGVVIGYEIAQALSLSLDVVITRKIGHPTNPEYAVCVTNEAGVLLCNEQERQSLNPEWLEEETGRQQEEAKRRARIYRSGRAPIAFNGKTVILTDDGIATGLTMRLAINMVKEQEPEHIVVAVPVAPPDAMRNFKREVDEVVVLIPPERFQNAVGAHYQEFAQVDDETVVALLSRQALP